MKKIIIILIVFFCFYSCKSTLNLSGTKYIYKSKQRKLELQFINDSICVLTNTFYCPDIASEYKIIVQKFTYNRSGDSIYVKNINPKFGNDLYIEILVQKSNTCDFLNENERQDKRLQHFYIGPNYATDFEKYGIIPNITTDTLRIIKNNIVYYKKDNRGSVGFIFKKRGIFRTRIKK
jgi:hypothetical protein